MMTVLGIYSPDTLFAHKALAATTVDAYRYWRTPHQQVTPGVTIGGYLVDARDPAFVARLPDLATTPHLLLTTPDASTIEAFVASLPLTPLQEADVTVFPHMGNTALAT